MRLWDFLQKHPHLNNSSVGVGVWDCGPSSFYPSLHPHPSHDSKEAEELSNLWYVFQLYDMLWPIKWDASDSSWIEPEPTGHCVFCLLVFCHGCAESIPRLTCWPQEESKSHMEQSHPSQATLTEASLAHPLIYSRKSSPLGILEQNKCHCV